MKLYFVESRADSVGFRERCHVWAENEESAARLSCDSMFLKPEYVWELPAPRSTEYSVTLFNMPQWRVAIYGNEFRLQA